MKKILFLFLVAGLLYACKKDKIGSKPILTFKGYTVDSVTSNLDKMTVIMNVRDGDGDIEDTLWIATRYRNSGTSDTLYSVKQMGSIGANKGNSVNADVYINLLPTEFKISHPFVADDSIHFVVFIKDNAGNFSDTVGTRGIPYNAQ
ncbi:hypothetical protein HGH93_04335 [Chitinophaga polysaccharea]|uniref:hypothetical protein n=1 Tax=Chitinophaga TaxID=79328 RepID=UPI0014554C29|nr:MULTISPECIES: hypothetical protein [Chitinophaga]NLR57312.1 hypothetical protein [Chitinophaga polysaccharea]NLU91570.1 hypothetical protein [Chitinophaga sp. Ak27]